MDPQNFDAQFQEKVQILLERMSFLNGVEFLFRYRQLREDQMYEMRQIVQTKLGHILGLKPSSLEWWICFLNSPAALEEYKQSTRREFKEKCVCTVVDFANAVRAKIPTTEYNNFKAIISMVQTVMDQQLEELTERIDPVRMNEEMHVAQHRELFYDCIGAWLLNIAGPKVQNCISQLRQKRVPSEIVPTSSNIVESTPPAVAADQPQSVVNIEPDTETVVETKSRMEQKRDKLRKWRRDKANKPVQQ